mmetsp:Transcript_2349/g.3378  ORF Transcript_2349/g.3378 Transcript_2349/m.3378 type:complete len:299 (-) Transcript_2349:137-1033(-)|eukprot:CAMPEP_0184478398 /NCGR_PEP_ID=MMETSP0113_2-20130426/442_1 /TAXON_ID=91329 /ORGANISM="Norrisiella sphaerica, Strain BC52" /LENGTH=298 /DNA_ID=CAMNT_0026856175 /DNA_START=92 /DNA_END=988 /DNA_ORIENTATION=+
MDLEQLQALALTKFAEFETTLESLPYPEFLKPEFEHAYFKSLVICSLTFFVLMVLAQVLALCTGWEPIDKLTFATSIVSGGIPALVIPYTIMPGILEIWNIGMSDPAKLPVLDPPPSVVKGCGISIGYMTYDLLMMLTFAGTMMRPKDKTKRKPGHINEHLFKQMIMHHVLSILVWPYVMETGTFVWPVAYFMLTEVTNLGLNGRSLVAIFGMDDSSIIGATVSIMWVLQFSVVRILPLPILAYFFVMGDYSKIWIVDKVVASLTVPIPFLLNIMWFGQIISMASRKLQGGSSKPKKE